MGFEVAAIQVVLHLFPAAKYLAVFSFYSKHEKQLHFVPGLSQQYRTDLEYV